jgi:hypothetical protein
MFNLFKVASLFQSVPNFNSLHDSGSAQDSHLDVPTVDTEVLFTHQDIHYANLPRKENGRQRSGNERKPAEKRGEPKDSKNKGKRDDDDNNNGGGFLEPIIEDLQGLLNGRRNPAPIPI